MDDHIWDFFNKMLFSNLLVYLKTVYNRVGILCQTWHDKTRHDKTRNLKGVDTNMTRKIIVLVFPNTNTTCLEAGHLLRYLFRNLFWDKINIIYVMKLILGLVFGDKESHELTNRTGSDMVMKRTEPAMQGETVRWRWAAMKGLIFDKDMAGGMCFGQKGLGIWVRVETSGP